ITVRDGTDVTVVANGIMVAAALDAAETLAQEGVSVRVLDMHTVKPVDEAALLAAARETGGIVVAEEHLAHGGLGSIVAMTLAASQPCPMRFVNVGDTYAESGSAEDLLEHYGLTGERIAEAVRDLRAGAQG